MDLALRLANCAVILTHRNMQLYVKPTGMLYFSLVSSEILENTLKINPKTGQRPVQ